MGKGKGSAQNGSKQDDKAVENAKRIKELEESYLDGDGKPSLVLDEDGTPPQLTKKDFPKNKAGKVAHCEYMLAVWLHRKMKAELGESDVDKITKRIAKSEAKLKADREKLAALTGGK